VGYTPSQILHAYGFDRIAMPLGIAADGAGTTIAIVDAYDDPRFVNSTDPNFKNSDLYRFDHNNIIAPGMALPDPPNFLKVAQDGSSNLPSIAPLGSDGITRDWATEIALDVEWTHAIAPAARILLVETYDNSFPNLLAGVRYAAGQPGVVAVSMSWGSPEFASETSLDSTFLTPSGHSGDSNFLTPGANSGVTFIASTGDVGAPPEYPAISPNVLAVGGTSLNLDGQGNYQSESAWSGSGGGISNFEAQPAYQNGVVYQNGPVTQSSKLRTNPDVAYDADPNTGFPVYDSLNNGSAAPWSQVGGTSAAVPQWAALIAIADRGRMQAGKGTLDGLSQALPLLYQSPGSDFQDITTGGSAGSPQYFATPGYDLVTGRGTPRADKIVADLIGLPVATTTTVTSSVNPQTVGQAVSWTAAVAPASKVNLVNFKTGDFSQAATHTGGAIVTSPILDGKYSLQLQRSNSVANYEIRQSGSTYYNLPTAYYSFLFEYTSIPSEGGIVDFQDTGSGFKAALHLSQANTLLFYDRNGTLQATGTTVLAPGHVYRISAGIGTGSDAPWTILVDGNGEMSGSGNLGTNKNGSLSLGGNGRCSTTYYYDDAAVDSQGYPGTVPTGNVQFSIDGSIPIDGRNRTLTGGLATYNNSLKLLEGTHSIQAVYSGYGDLTFTGSTGSLIQTFTKAATSTSVSSSSNPSASGQNVTLTATITPNGPSTVPTGAVQWQVDGKDVGGPVALGAPPGSGVATATFPTNTLSDGTHTITAKYSGDDVYLPSMGSMQQTVGSSTTATTTTTVTSSANPSGVGQNVTFTATVTGSGAAGAPTGSVTFQEGTTTLGTGPLSGSGGTAKATFTTSSLPAGNHTIIASYGGDNTFASSSSAGLTQTVVKASSTTTVASTANPSTVGQSVTFTATVTGAGTPTGSVTFLDGAATLGTGTLSGSTATATFTTTSLPAGNHTITVSYGGDNTFAGSSSAALTQAVVKASSTTTVASSANPSTVGQSVTFTATVTGAGTPTGSVTFLDGAATLGTGTLSGSTATATFTTTSLPAGNHTITASYGGDNSFASGTSAALTQAVGNATTTTVISSANPQAAGQPVSWTTTVAAAGSVNLVDFETGDFSQAAAHTGGAIVTSPTFDGKYSLQLQRSSSAANYEIRQNSTTYYDLPTAYYSFLFEYTTPNPGEGGIVNFQDSGSTFKAALHLSAAGNLLLYGKSGTLLATGSTVLAPGQVNSISAMIGTGSNAPWEIRTNGNVEMSGSGNLGTNNNGSVKLGGNGTYTTTYYYDDVAINSQGYPGPVPTGTVQFAIDGSPFGVPVALSGGSATSGSTSTLPAGSHPITATYSGISPYATSTGTFTQTIIGQSTVSSSTALSSSLNPSTMGQGVTFMATVAGSGSSTPTGNVTFLDGTSTLGQGTLNGSGGTATATFTTSGLTVGSHNITASYGGDSTFASSTSAALTQTVNNPTTAGTTTTVTSSANPQTAGQPASWTATVAAAGSVNFVNFETGDFSQAATHTGGAIVASPLLDGMFSLQLQRSSSVANYEIRESGATYYNLPTAYYSFLFESTSNSGEGGIVNFQDTGSGFKAALHLSPTNTLEFYDRTGTVLAIGNTVLASGQVYTISAMIGTGSAGAWEIRINGNLEMSGTGSLGTNNNGSLKLGGNGTYTTTYFYDNVSINSQGYPPTGAVQFFIDNHAFGLPVALLGGSAISGSTNTLSAGSHTITAIYSGDSTYATSTGTLAQTINSVSGLVNSVDFETGDFSQAATHIGGTIVTSPALDGTHSLQLMRSNSVANYEIRQSGTTYYNLPTAYYSFLFEYTSNLGEGGIVNFQDTGSHFKAALHLSSDGRLLFYDQTLIQKIGTTVLASDQVYALSTMIGTGTNAGWEIRINGNVEMSGTGNLGTTNNGSIKLGGNSPYTTTYFYDDVAIDSQGYPAGSGAAASGPSLAPSLVRRSEMVNGELRPTAGFPSADGTTLPSTLPVSFPSPPLPLPTAGGLPSSIVKSTSMRRVTPSTAALDAFFADWDSRGSR
jgi:hypothetical protein